MTEGTRRTSSSTILVILVGNIPKKPSRILVSGELIPSYYYLFCLSRLLHIPFIEIPEDFQFLIEKELIFSLVSVIFIHLTRVSIQQNYPSTSELR